MQKLKYGALVVIILLIVSGGYAYWRHEQRYPTTEDAYLDAQVVRIAAQIDGRITQVAVHDHEHVDKGQLLLQIDPQPLRLDLQQAQAKLTLTNEQIAAANDAVTEAKALVKQRYAELGETRANTKRNEDLVKRGVLSQAQGDAARFELKAAQSALRNAKAGLARARQERGSKDLSNARLLAAKAAVAQAKLNLSYSRITAPSSGILGEVKLAAGDMVQNGVPLFPLLEDKVFWVNANYKESDLKRIHPGQHARITIDMYPGVMFHGRVDSLSPASGTAFSLLPPENATGNWVKVTQRFPVKVIITDTDPRRPLRIGASSRVVIDTGETPAV